MTRLADLEPEPGKTEPKSHRIGHAVATVRKLKDFTVDDIDGPKVKAGIGKLDAKSSKSSGKGSKSGAKSSKKAPGKRGYKWPTLQEAFTHFTGAPFVGAHGAMADAQACREVYRRMHLPQPVPA